MLKHTIHSVASDQVTGQIGQLSSILPNDDSLYLTGISEFLVIKTFIYAEKWPEYA